MLTTCLSLSLPRGQSPSSERCGNLSEEPGGVSAHQAEALVVCQRQESQMFGASRMKGLALKASVVFQGCDGIPANHC